MALLWKHWGNPILLVLVIILEVFFFYLFLVNLHRISEAIKHCMKENSELVGEISRCTQKV